MRFNKAEVAGLAAQPSHKFEKEGVLFVRERQEGFFRRTEKLKTGSNRRSSPFSCYGGSSGRVSVERWCRLRGNLLFYFKSRDQLSEPAGVIVVEDCKVEAEANAQESTFGIILSFGGGLQQHLATYTESERDAWTAALSSASHHTMKSHLTALRDKLRAKLAGNPGLLSDAEAADMAAATTTTEQSVILPASKSSSSLSAAAAAGGGNPVIDPAEAPLLEMGLSCDNLLCDALGRAPSARLVVHVKNPSEISWRRFAQTEVAEKSSNPGYLRTISFHPSEDISGKTEVRISAYDFRERFTSTCTQLGRAKIQLQELKTEARVRLKLESPNPDGRAAGFVTLSSWSYEHKVPGSTDSTPMHTATPTATPISNSTFSASASTTNCGIAHSISGNMADLAANGPATEAPIRDVVRRAPNPRPRQHRRTQSLPPHTSQPARLPDHKALTMLFANPSLKTYRFHSGLAGDITVQELMAESRLCYTFPQQLLSLWICEEKELVHEIAGLGELKSPWHKCQMTWLQNHLHIINTYSQALENLDNYRGASHFRKSTQKSDRTYEFVPTNLHLQRMWADNESLRKSAFSDIFTHGAFTAYAHKSPGLIKMLKDLKAPQKDSSAWCSQSDRLQLAEDTLNAVRRVRREVVDSMRVLMKQGKDKRSDGMFVLVEDMLRKTKCLCSLMDQAMVEEAFGFLEDNRITTRPERDEFSESVAEFMQKHKLKIDLQPLLRPNKVDSLQTPNTEFVCKELRTPEVDHLFSPSSGADPASSGGGMGHTSEFWRSYSSYTSGYQSVDRLSDIDEFEENFKYLSVVDKTRPYYTLCRTGTPIEDTPVATPEMTPKRHQAKVLDEENHELDEEDEGIEEVMQVEADAREDESDLEPEPEEQEENNAHEAEAEKEESGEEATKPVSNGKEEKEEQEEKADGSKEKQEDAEEQGDRQTTTADDSPSGLHYRAGDEPEPIDLTHLNIEAAMMCLASKVRVLCGKANSPTLSSRTFRFRELDGGRLTTQQQQQLPKSASQDSAAAFKIPDVPRPSVMQQDGAGISDWAAELRPSMRKLRQGMDSLCKTSRLVCSVLRLQQLQEAVNLSHSIKYRRDVCFSQALTSLVTALMARFWAAEPDPTFLTLCCELGPLVQFEGLLSLHGEDVAIFNDMLVAVEDLRSVEFTLILVDKRSGSRSARPKASTTTTTQMLPYHSFPLPRVTGSRTSLKVMLPVPDYVYTMLPLERMKTMTFGVTPVFFNVGINENATIAGRFGNNGPQEKNNVDNFKILCEYSRRYRKLNLPTMSPNLGGGGGRSKRASFYSNEPDIDDLLAILKNEANNRKNKNVEILHLASNICRRLSGIRFTCCKSGKDRTAMSATLEQVQILSREFDLAEHEYQKALDVMRSEGTRRDNTLKNIDDRRYAFNTIQLATFPYQYRPPVGTYGSGQT